MVDEKSRMGTEELKNRHTIYLNIEEDCSGNGLVIEIWWCLKITNLNYYYYVSYHFIIWWNQSADNRKIQLLRIVSAKTSNLMRTWHRHGWYKSMKQLDGKDGINANKLIDIKNKLFFNVVIEPLLSWRKMRPSSRQLPQTSSFSSVAITSSSLSSFTGSLPPPLQLRCSSDVLVRLQEADDGIAKASILYHMLCYFWGREDGFSRRPDEWLKTPSGGCLRTIDWYLCTNWW